MPSLRKTLIQLLTELEYSTSARSKEEASTLLGLLVGASQRLTRPYVVPMLNVLLPKSRDASPAVASSIMTTLGELARVGGEDLLVQLGPLMALILDTLHDQASTVKREAALHTLGQLSSYAGYVIDPYLDHPSLLGLLIGLLKTESGQHTRREIIRVMGTLGALDPYRHTVVEGISNDAYVEAFNPTDPTHPSNIGPQHDEYYPTIAFSALLVVFNDPSLSEHHTAVVDAIMYIFRSLRLKVVTFLPQVLPAFLNVMRSCPVGLQEYYFQNLGQLISMVKQHVRNHLAPIMATIREFWTTTTNPGLQVIIVDVIQSIALALDAEFKAYLPNLLPLMLQAFEQNLGFKEARRQNTLIRVLHAFGIFGSSLEEYLHLVIPAIVRTFEQPDVPLILRKQAMQTITQLSRKLNFADHASSIVHPIARVLSSPMSPAELRTPAMEALCAILLQMGSDFVLFVGMINKVRSLFRSLSRSCGESTFADDQTRRAQALVKNRIVHAHYEALVARLLKGEPLPQNLTFGDPCALLPLCSLELTRSVRAFELTLILAPPLQDHPPEQRGDRRSRRRRRQAPRQPGHAQGGVGAGRPRQARRLARVAQAPQRPAPQVVAVAHASGVRQPRRGVPAARARPVQRRLRLVLDRAVRPVPGASLSLSHPPSRSRARIRR